VSKWPMVKLKEINEYESSTVNPQNYPKQIFELYSIPSYDTSEPEFILGANIGSNK